MKSGKHQKRWHRVCRSAGLLGFFGSSVPLLIAQSTSFSVPLVSHPTSANSEMDNIDSVNQSRHLEVGQIMTVNTVKRVNKLYVGDPAVLDSYVANPRQIVLIAKAPGVSSAVLWDETGKMQSFAVTADLPTTQLQASLHKALPNEDVQAQADGTRIILHGTLSTRVKADQAVKLAGLFSKDVVDALLINSARAQQVELKVRFVEVDRTRLTQFGINLFGPGGGSALGAGTTGQFPSSASLSLSGTGSNGAGASGGVLAGGETLSVSNPLNYLFFSSKLGAGVTIQDLESKQIAQILAEPTITTLSGQSASFLAGGEFPFPVVQGSSGGTTSITIQFRPYGVKLDFTPKVNPDGTIELKVMPEVSALDYTNAVTISGYTIPAIATKHADTQVVLRSGQSFAISGLLDKQTTDSLARTPGLAGIPVLGALFKSKSVNLNTSELIVIVTPTIVDPLSNPATVPEPAFVRPMLNSQQFDRQIPAVKSSALGETAKR